MRRDLPTLLMAALGALTPPSLPAASAIPVAPVRPVTDTYFGTAVVDPYRWMEAGGEELMDYMRSENAVTQETLAPFAQQDAHILEELTQLADTVPAISAVTRTLDRYFYLETPPGKSDAQLMTRAAAGGAEQLLLDPATMASGAQHAAIDYFVPSPNAKYVAVGVSLGGSENSVLHVIDTATGRLMSESISRAQEGNPSWTHDSKSFYFSRLQPMAPAAPAATKYDNMRVYFHRLGTDEAADQAIFGPDITSDPVLPKNGSVAAHVVEGTKMLLVSQVSGVVETPAFWVRRSGERGKAGAAWIKVIAHEDGVLALDSHGTRIYAMTKAGAGSGPSNGRVVSFDLASSTFAAAQVVLPESSLILSANRATGVLAAQDALYVYGFRDGLAVVRRIPYRQQSQGAELSLPVSGSAGAVSAQQRRSGFTLMMQGWTTPRLIYAYSPQSRRFADTGLQLRSPVDMSGIAAKEVLVAGADGTTVPLSILHRRDLPLDGSHPTLLQAYGAYGISIPAVFDVSLVPWLNRGGIFAVAHVRGGGERGEAWHLAGMKLTKQHTVEDFIACARYLIDQKYTSPAHLGVSGTSAGGIAVGGFLTQRPELISAVLYRVGISDILRSEQRATGAQNAYEYGSVGVEPEFRAMYAISPYAQVQDDKTYPAVMLETGANDPRVTSWMLTKMTARLQAANALAGGPNPILLRVDFDAGHGIGSGRAQALKLRADEYTFLGWRLGMSGFEASP
ncbi:MAG TPA: prolyl oligopeptidase family serine peptidase [Steroidobacteraceae bacterium]|nr:prolyl oligopeptidase family serine peptidase [Steroidobacteraceae bacterium]